MIKRMILVGMVLWGTGAFSQTNMPVVNVPLPEAVVDSDNFTNSNINTVLGNRDPNYNYSTQPIDSNTEFKHLKEGLVMQGGQLKVIRNGYAFKMRGSFPLKNGAVLYPDGIIKMPDGSKPVLDEKNYVDFDGHIRPLNNITSISTL